MKIICIHYTKKTS